MILARLTIKNKQSCSWNCTVFIISSDTFYLLANQSLDPNLQNIAKDYIVHYDYDQVDSALQVLQNLRIKILWNPFRPWTMWRGARWWWPRPGSCLTSSSGRSSPTSSGSPACTSWRLELVLIESISCPGLSLSLWCGLCSAKRLSLYKEVHPVLLLHSTNRNTPI